MKCFACDVLLLKPEQDRPTGRFYCSTCFEATLEVQLAAATKEISWAKVSTMDSPFSFKGVSDVLEHEGWAAFSDMVHLHKEEQEDDEEDLPW